MQIAPHRQDGVSSTVTVSLLDNSGAEAHPAARGISPRPETDGLYTAMLHLDFKDHGFSMFHACRVVSRREVMERVGVRVPSHLLPHVDIREGIDLDHPVVVRLVPREISRRLADYGDCDRGHGPLRLGGDLHIQQRSG
ncbi:hypothetical protein [Sphingobium sp. HWE2-09]|uniref:hypothetical protein n=1 Tax=Sphingobium sp. HWE2-09 TaxID=3108390 RepID=UPI002DC33B7E|nr:hypothetical protein [Sphingobium sp. HWE2-09]